MSGIGRTARDTHRGLGKLVVQSTSHRSLIGCQSSGFDDHLSLRATRHERPQRTFASSFAPSVDPLTYPLATARKVGRRYLSAMGNAANFAFANRLAAAEHHGAFRKTQLTALGASDNAVAVAARAIRPSWTTSGCTACSDRWFKRQDHLGSRPIGCGVCASFPSSYRLGRLAQRRQGGDDDLFSSRSEPQSLRGPVPGYSHAVMGSGRLGRHLQILPPPKHPHTRNLLDATAALPMRQRLNWVASQELRRN
jgi:hypothetical protein